MAQIPPPIDEFILALSCTRKHCFFLDQYFCAEYMVSLAGAFAEYMPPVVRVITGSQDAASEIGQILTEIRVELPYSVRRSVVLGVGYIKGDRQLSVHDRFAILDDDLWHFGSTIGVSCGHLTAVSLWIGAFGQTPWRSYLEIWDYLRSRKCAWEL